MRIAQIEDLDKVRRKVSLVEGESFWLYKKDILEYNLKENTDIGEELYERILKEKVLLYAKKKALELLERMDRTEQELKHKLLTRDFPSAIVDDAILYAKQFHYIDDLRYAIHFIRTKSSVKSKKQICFMLYQKGIAKEYINQAYEEVLQDGLLDQIYCEDKDCHKTNPEITAIQRIINRKGKPMEEYTKEEIQKLIASLYRKGFSSESIRFVLSCDIDYN